MFVQSTRFKQVCQLLLSLIDPIDNTLVVQYLLVQGCLKLRVHEKKKRMAKSTLS